MKRIRRPRIGFAEASHRCGEDVQCVGWIGSETTHSGARPTVANGLGRTVRMGDPNARLEAASDEHVAGSCDDDFHLAGRPVASTAIDTAAGQQ